jgi:hypothetical protein
MDSDTTVYFTSELRAQWPSQLVERWSKECPDIFDEEHIRNTKLQPRNHVNEWFAAVSLFRSRGALSLVEKYLFANHSRKVALLEKILNPAQLTALREIHKRLGIQPPDLLVFLPDFSRFWFAEVKGPGDRIRPAQRESHEAIRRELGVPVQQIAVRRQTPSK